MSTRYCQDRNHFGPAPNKLMPDVVNMETSLNIHVNGRENALWKRLSQTQQTVEMNLRCVLVVQSGVSAQNDTLAVKLERKTNTPERVTKPDRRDRWGFVCVRLGT